MGDEIKYVTPGKAVLYCVGGSIFSIMALWQWYMLLTTGSVETRRGLLVWPEDALWIIIRMTPWSIMLLGFLIVADTWRRGRIVIRK